MPPRKKTPAAAQKAPVRHFTFHLTLSGVAGVALAAFCLFLWMFFLGMWAGRTIIFPCPASAPVEQQIRQQQADQQVQPETAPPRIAPRIKESDPPVIPKTSTDSTGSPGSETSATSAICVRPRERKRRVSSGEPSLYQGP
ncbi:MAG: hypothetical protein D3914_16505 [Candidatus Electrothrix sp. LOE2]|nr:hypothetical protein [Candidatus Electrothrix sp. LOE2]